MAHGWHSGRSTLTNNVEVVRVIDGPVIVLHHAGIISFVRRDHTFHNKAPMLVSYLRRGKAVMDKFSTEYQLLHCFCDLKSWGDKEGKEEPPEFWSFLTIRTQTGRQRRKTMISITVNIWQAGMDMFRLKRVWRRSVMSRAWGFLQKLPSGQGMQH